MSPRVQQQFLGGRRIPVGWDGEIWTTNRTPTDAVPTDAIPKSTDRTLTDATPTVATLTDRSEPDDEPKSDDGPKSDDERRSNRWAADRSRPDSAPGQRAPSSDFRRADGLAGAPATTGRGNDATFFTEGRSGTPRYLGIWFTADALDGLPDGEHSPAHVTTLPLPAAAGNGSPVRWVTVDWNPEGHVPADVYDVPHFDFHFHLQPQAVVERQIRPGEYDVDEDGTPDAGVPCDVLERGTEPIPPAQRPPGYQPTDEIVPRMGNHWVNVDAPEFRGEPFTHTWIYGSFDGELTFLEAMVPSTTSRTSADGRSPVSRLPTLSRGRGSTRQSTSSEKSATRTPTRSTSGGSSCSTRRSSERP